MKSIHGDFSANAFALLVGILLLFSACDVREKGGNALNQAAKSTSSCSAYKTENQGDGENKISRLGVDYKFNLYWNGPSSKFSVWENNGLNDSYEVSFDPLKIHVLGADGKETETLICKANKASAAKCAERFEGVLAMTKDVRHAHAEANGSLSSGKAMTFKCSEEFINKKLAELKAFRAAAP